MSVKDGPYPKITVKMTHVAVIEAIAEVFNRKRDWKGACVSELAYEIAEKLGFESPYK